MSLLDEWLKAPPDGDDASGPQHEGDGGGGGGGGGHAVSGGDDGLHDDGAGGDPMDDVGSNLPADLQLPDLGLSDIKWWMDLEFLDLASGPPANLGHNDRASNAHHRMKTPTFDYHFPDLFLDSNATNLFSGGSGLNQDEDSSAPGDRDGGGGGGTGDGDHLDFEKGLLADLFPAAAAAAAAAADVEPGDDKADDIFDGAAPEATVAAPSAASQFFQPVEPAAAPRSLKRPRLRIQSVHIGGEPHVPPDGAVARFEIRTDEARNATTFAVMAPDGADVDSLTVNTADVARATRMVKPVHWERIPMLMEILGTMARSKDPKVAKGKVDVAEEAEAEAAVSGEETTNLERELIDELEGFGVRYEKIERRKRGWMCPEGGCARAFPKRSKLKLHIFAHRNIRPFHCDVQGCSWAFHTSFKLKRHVETAHAPSTAKKVFSCEVEDCRSRNVTFTTANNLNHHLKRCHNPERSSQPNAPFKCRSIGCDAGYRTRRGLSTHLKRSSHPDVVPPHGRCDVCKRWFFSEAEAISHSHSSARPSAADTSSSYSSSSFSCPFDGCVQSFAKSSLLEVHARVHTGERPYRCDAPGCGWAFRTASKLSRHSRSHSDRRVHVCHVCDKSYRRPEHLKDHLLVAHSSNAPRFSCTVEGCSSGKGLVAKSTLYAHMKRHRCEAAAAAAAPPADAAAEEAEALDLIALLSSVGDDEEGNNLDNGQELVTVDASAISPVKSGQEEEEEGEIEAKKVPSKPPTAVEPPPNNRKKMRPSILRRSCSNGPVAKKRWSPEVEEEKTTINMRDLA